jgi:hypothetical protein
MENTIVETQLGELRRTGVACRIGRGMIGTADRPC